MATVDFFKEIGVNYNNVSDRQMIYNDIRSLQKEAEEIFEAIEETDNEEKFKQWMNYCWLKKIPYIFLENGTAFTPRTFEEWQEKLSIIGKKKLYGVLKAINRLGRKNMDLVFYLTDEDGDPIKQQVPILELLVRHASTLNLLGDNEESEKEEI
ncbi:MAG: hypothetical protein OEL89_01270 [Candidatus Peregrinibacteria bacterium]|nr:hypothetical protein [Candidatus Peregrinibacteria bacterium]